MNSVERTMELCQKHGVSIAKLERECGFANGYLRRLKGGVLPADRAQIVADYFNVSLRWLVTGIDSKELHLTALTKTEQHLWAVYRGLSSDGKAVVEAVLSYVSDAEKKGRNTTAYPYLGRLAAAGSSVFSEDIPVEIINVAPMQDADLIVGVNGDSMEPTFEDGDMIYVQRASKIRPGEIGIFQTGNEFYIKELGKDGLVSHNPAYPVMHGEFKCVGKVLGKVGG